MWSIVEMIECAILLFISRVGDVGAAMAPAPAFSVGDFLKDLVKGSVEAPAPARSAAGRRSPLARGQPRLLAGRPPPTHA